MATEIMVHAKRAAKLSLPPAVNLRLKWLGTVQGKKYLSAGLPPLTNAERSNITRQIEDIERELHPVDGDDDRKTVMVAEMLASLAGGQIDRVTIKAKQRAYSVGLMEVPAWIVRMAIDDWYQGKSRGVDVLDYQWPPGPGVLAMICRELIKPFRAVIEDLTDVLNAKPLEETMRELDRRQNDRDVATTP